MDPFDRDRRAAALLVEEAAGLLRRRKTSDDDYATGDFSSTLREMTGGTISPRTRARSTEIAERAGVQPSLRDSVMLELPMQRDMSVAGVSGSNYLVATGNAAGIFLQSLQGTMIGARLGVRMLAMGKNFGTLPVVSTPPTTTWLSSETVQISTSQPVIGSRLAEPKAVAAKITFSHQLVSQSNPAVEALLMAELARAVAAAVDNALFNGTGVSGQPQGLLSIPGTVSASGGSLDLADIADLIEDCVTAGSAMVSPGFACDGPVQEILLTRARATNVGEMLTDDATRLAGYPLQASKNGPASGLIFCDWSTVYLPTWGALELKLDPFTDFSTGKVSLRAILYVDVLVAHPGAIAIRTSVS
jgi:hypothetical protein